MNKQFVFLSGLPRSGSQVLSSLMNQHPLIYSTPTSPVADMVGIVVENWFRISGAIANRDPAQYENMIEGLMQGAYKHLKDPIIVDKNRLWPRYIKELNAAFKVKPKIICTVRDIASIVASYILLIRKNAGSVSFIDQDLIESRMVVNDKNRCRILVEKYIMHPYNSLRVGTSLKMDVDLLFLDYNDIVSDSQTTMDRICNFIGLDEVIVDLKNLQPMDENDGYHGGLSGLHEVRPVMSKTSASPEQVIGKELTEYCRSLNLEFWRNLK